MPLLSRALLAATFATLLAPLPAHAALVNDYSFTDDVWNTPIAPGHVLVDVRASAGTTRPPSFAAPVATLAVGLAPGLEAGAWGANAFGGDTAASNLLNPYLKFQLPFTAGAVGFGLVAGAQIPAFSAVVHNIALEGVATVPVNHALSLDLGLGAGRDLVTQSNLGHANVTAYELLPAGQTLVGALYALFDSAAATTWGQQLGVYFPLGASLTTDLSLTASETDGALVLTPMAGVTDTF